MSVDAELHRSQTISLFAADAASVVAFPGKSHDQSERTRDHVIRLRNSPQGAVPASFIGVELQVRMMRVVGVYHVWSLASASIH